MKKLNRLVPGALVLLSLLVVGPNAPARSADLNTKNIVKKGYSQLFTYDPENSGTVAVSYVNKFSRLSALLVQPHTVVKTACGYLFENMRGLPLSTATYTVDVSNDTKFSNKANLILIGITHSGAYKLHVDNGLNFDSSSPSNPGWTTYHYSAKDFSPAIGSDETFASLAISLFGGHETNPDHTDHWLSRPTIDGINVRELVNDSVVVTDGRLVGF